MTVPATSRRSPVYTGNGVATAFAFTYKVFTTADVQVLRTNADGTISTLVLDSDYSVALNADQTTIPGGTVTYPISGSPLASPLTLVILGNLPYDQTLSLPGGGNFNPRAIEQNFDRTEMQIQQLADKANASLTVPVGETVPPFPVAASRANRVSAFDGDGNPTVLVPEPGTAAAVLIDLADASTAARGDKLVAVKRTATGAAATTGHDWLEEQPLHMSADLGVAADGTDQTAAVVAKLAALGASFEGEIVLPIGLRADLQQVFEAIPDKAVLRFVGVRQSGAGYRQQMVGVADNPPNANTDTAFVVASTHYPDVMLNNLRTAGTTSATAGRSGFSWARGFFRNGTNGPRLLWQANFEKSSVRAAEYGGAGVGSFRLVTRAPERAGNYESWFNGIVVAVGDYIEAANGYYYRCTAFTGPSTVSPTHTSGSSTVGGVTWQFESSFVPFRTAFYVDELGRLGSNAADTGYTHNWQQNPEDTEDFNVWYTAAGASKRIRMRFQPTNGASALVGAPTLDVSETGGLRLLDSTLARVYFRARDTAGFELANFGLFTNTVADLDTTPSATNGGRLVFSNSGATNVTTLDDATENQVVCCYATNGNTTLVHSANFKLKGAVNVTLAADQMVFLMRNPANTAWVEMSRNF